MNNPQLEQLSTHLSQLFTPEQITFSQAISICSVMIEMGLQRASLEDITDGLEQRFKETPVCNHIGETIERNHIQNVAYHAISFGLEVGLFEPVDTETITLSTQGMFIGRNWLYQIHQEAA